MDLTTISQIANPILQTVFIVVIGLGYYFTVRTRRWFRRCVTSIWPGAAVP